MIEYKIIDIMTILTMKICNKCQGIMTLVRNDVEATVINQSIDDIDYQLITRRMKGNNSPKFTIYNI